MSCEHAENTLLWAYGEGDPAHELHVATCASCQVLVAELEGVEAALAPVAPALAAPRRRRLPWAMGGLALAAAALFAVLVPSPAPGPSLDAARLQAALDAPDPLMSELDALDAQLDLLEDDLDPLEF